MDRQEARNFIDAYCYDVPPEGAEERLMSSSFELNDTESNSRVELRPGIYVEQDELDAVIYNF